MSEQQKAYICVFLDCEDFEIDSVWLNKAKADHRIEAMTLTPPEFYRGWDVVLITMDVSE
jgi:hypothetical protein